MSNMSYCRFRNTAGDLNDCVRHLRDRDLSDEEHRARVQLVELAREIVDELDGEDPKDLPHGEDDEESDDQ